MKKYVIYPYILGISTVILLSFKSYEEYQARNSTAEVNQEQGLYIFTDSKPVKEYEYLGTVKLEISLINSGQYDGVKSTLIRKGKRDYPQANGIILNLVEGGTDRGDLIKFK